MLAINKSVRYIYFDQMALTLKNQRTLLCILPLLFRPIWRDRVYKIQKII